jgi:hypothetical protein
MASESPSTPAESPAREVSVEKKVRGGYNPSNITEQELTPEYVYATNQSVEDFNNTPFQPFPTTKNDLSPPSPFKPRKMPKNYGIGDSDYCANNPTSAECLDSEGNSFCDQNPNHPNCHDERNDYQELGLFAEQVRYIFDPAKRSDENVRKKSVSTLYETKMDDTQTDVPQTIRTECRCKDGTKKMGWLDIRSGQKDCSSCNEARFNSPNPYKNYKTKRSTPNFSGKSVPLRKQVGVSHFGDVEMKGCQTGNAAQSLEQRNKISTLNNVTNVDTQDSIGGSTITVPENTSGMPISLYDNLKTNVYGL